MTEFTKEELEDYAFLLEKRLNKVKLIIATMCDHKWEKATKDQDIHDYGNETYYKCSLCSERRMEAPTDETA